MIYYNWSIVTNIYIQDDMPMKKRTVSISVIALTLLIAFFLASCAAEHPEYGYAPETIIHGENYFPNAEVTVELDSGLGCDRSLRT